MEMKHNEKIVEIKDKDNWSYNEVACSKLKELNAELYEEVQKAVEHYIENKEKIDEENRQKEKQERFEKNKALFEAWKKEIEEGHETLLKGQVVKFQEPRLDDWSFNKRVDIGHVEVYYDGTVVRSGSWRASSTDRPWVVQANYKNVRYGTLLKALTKAIEKNNEIVAERRAKKNKEEAEQYAEMRLASFAKENGFELSKDWHRRGGAWSRDYSGYYTYSMKKGCVEASIRFNEATDEVEITSYTVTPRNAEGKLSFVSIEKLNQEVQ